MVYATIKNMHNKLRAIYTVWKSTNNVSIGVLYRKTVKGYRQAVTDDRRLANGNYIINANNRCKSSWKMDRNETRNTDNNVCVLSFSPGDFNTFCIGSVLELKQNMNFQSFENSKTLLKHGPDVETNFNWFLVYPSDVIKAVRGLKTSKSCDLYGMSNYILKKIVYEISVPVSRLINFSGSGIYLDVLKVSEVIPVHKKGKEDSVKKL